MSSKGHGIVLLGSELAWFGCYECGMTLKSRTTTRRWNPSQKCWTLAASELIVAWDVLKKHHPEAQIVDEDGVVQAEPVRVKGKTQKSWWEEEYIRRLNERKQREQQTARKGPLAPPTWADLMFNSIPADLHESVFKSLLHVLHPDKGGDEEAVRALLDAREKQRGVA